MTERYFMQLINFEQFYILHIFITLPNNTCVVTPEYSFCIYASDQGISNFHHTLVFKLILKKIKDRPPYLTSVSSK